MNPEVIFGLGVGYNYAVAQKKEAELKQGKNDYQASLYQIQEVSSFTSIACNVLSKIPYAPVQMGATIGSVALPLTSFFLMPTSAAIKNGHYEQGANYITNRYTSLKWILPEKIEESGANFFTFLSDNTSVITNVGLAVSLVALPFLGFGTVAAGIGAPLAYQALESYNLIPTGLSVWVEKYMPTLVTASMIATGGPLSKVIALGTLSSGLPGVSDYAQKKVEKVFLSNVCGASLEEIDGPWLEKTDLTFNEILMILDDENLYEINPAHCSKPIDTPSLPKDYDFKKILDIFDKVDWKERYTVLRSKFLDDDRFQKKKKLKSIILDEEFFAERLKKQIHCFVAILCGEKAAKGNAQDLQDAIESTSSILGYLNNSPLNIAVEDILMKLAIEGGNYCARGLKRTTAEIHSGLIVEDPSYALAIHARLQNIRQQILQNMYQKLIEALVTVAKVGEGARVSLIAQTTDTHAVAIAQDVHTMDLYRRYLALGFYPLTENERSQFGLADFASWTFYHPFRNNMYLAYQNALDQAILEHGEIHFTDYMMNKIKELPLQPNEKEQLLDKLIMCEEGEKTMKSFRRLFFVMQGILNIKPPYADWTELPGPSLSEDAIKKELSEWELT